MELGAVKNTRYLTDKNEQNFRFVSAVRVGRLVMIVFYFIFQVEEARKSRENKHEQELLPKQFLDIVRSGSADIEVSNSSSEERTRNGPRSPGHIIELGSSGQRVDQDCDTRRLESPDSETKGWVPSKAPRLEGPKAMDQSVEATTRKARVSVRALSEASMV